MGKQERDFKGIWIPKDVWLDNRMSANEKVILMEVDSLDGEDGCYASNKFISDFCQCSESTVSRALARLTELGYISIESFDGRKRVLHSNLVKMRNAVVKMMRLPSQNDEAVSSKRRAYNIDSNIGNNIGNNYINSEKAKPSKPDGFSDEIDAIVSHLNAKTGKHFRAKTDATRKLIRARLRDGYTVEDFKRVIDNKTSQWIGTEWEKFLRPSTLFKGTNFENYANETSSGVALSYDPQDYELEEWQPQ